MTPAEFHRMGHLLDPEAVTELYRVYLMVRDVDGARARILDAVTRLDRQAQVVQFKGAHPSVAPPPPTGGPHLAPAAS